MKKLIITLLSLTTFCFAKEGAADELASYIFLVGFVFLVLPAIMYVVVSPIIIVCEFVEKLWKNTNTFGKLVCFGLPGTIITGTIFYFLIWVAIPFIIELVCEWPIVSASITASLYYLSTILTGWTILNGWINGNLSHTIKRNGKYALFSRIFASLPILPVILVCWLIKNSFGFLFIKDYTVTNILGFWKMPISESELLERRREEFFDKIADGKL